MAGTVPNYDSVVTDKEPLLRITDNSDQDGDKVEVFLNSERIGEYTAASNGTDVFLPEMRCEVLCLVSRFTQSLTTPT
ncbi:MAG: hypothetical protein F6K42_07445 [Leptolyngbya sp. SIO1D8]|nr:hypothetical protein [Leptolyngbya sp. SIO1D8]